QLMLVDLAGSERIERTGAQATGEQQKEANHINQSVSRLMHCLRVLRDKQAPSAQLSAVVPWRESKLTHLFQNHLAPSNGSPAARVAMIVNVSPSAADHAESCYVMGNAASAKAVAVRAAA
ncbi:kinesin motor domain-containing protein, partial [Pelagophyceae sp. CCMP2097]